MRQLFSVFTISSQCIFFSLLWEFYSKQYNIMDHVSSAVGGTLVGCVGCMLSMESLTKEDPNCVNLITFAMFLWVSFVGFLQQSRCFRRWPRNKIPIMRGYLPIVILFFIINVGNNLALTFDIPVPLFIIFKSGALLTNMVLGYLLRNRFFTRRKVSSVVAVTAGIILFTIASYDPTRADTKSKASSSIDAWFSRWIRIPRLLIGVGLLTNSLVLSAYLGLYQEDMYHRYGKHAKEAMFYVHMLSLPGFLFLYRSIWDASLRLSKLDLLSPVGFTNYYLSRWFRLCLTCILQWMCVENIYFLTTQTSSLTVTMLMLIYQRQTKNRKTMKIEFDQKKLPELKTWTELATIWVLGSPFWSGQWEREIKWI
ncbi:hypothetical protein AB6A40_007711 [Gnathostoma spinigerum]|uniref:Uncharacterized protein n=1 Tax=Gnathostoma spinigerum TaxID=75299 RepID=A0ABD6EWE7_9BILA